MFTCIIPTSLASSPMVNVIALVKSITLTNGDEAKDVGMIQVNIR
jgi:hypothetical protein